MRLLIGCCQPTYVKLTLSLLNLRWKTSKNYNWSNSTYIITLDMQSVVVNSLWYYLTGKLLNLKFTKTQTLNWKLSYENYCCCGCRLKATSKAEPVHELEVGDINHQLWPSAAINSSRMMSLGSSIKTLHSFHKHWLRVIYWVESNISRKSQVILVYGSSLPIKAKTLWILDLVKIFM